MKKYLFVFAAGAIVTAAAWLFLPRLWTKPNAAHVFDLDRAAVIEQVRSLNRLETAAFTIEKIIEAGTDYNRLSELLFGDHVLLVAHGEVTAGFDLTTLTEKDIEGRGDRLILRLPAPHVIATRLDNDQTKVFDRKTGLLNKGDLNLESEARQQAETAITKAACDGKILDAANERGKQQLEVLFRTAGFTEVTIITAAPQACP